MCFLSFFPFLPVEANLRASITSTGFSSFLLDEFVLMLAFLIHDSEKRNPPRGTFGSLCLSQHPAPTSSLKALVVFQQLFAMLGKK